MAESAEKVDFKKSLDSYRARKGAFRLVDVPPMSYLAIDGHGDPNTAPSYAAAIETLHVGPYDAEGPVLEEMHSSFIPDQGLALSGTHHEIYLSDVRKTAPEKLRTILRQPVRPA